MIRAYAISSAYMAVRAASEPCQERRGLDCAVASFSSASPRHQQEVFDFCCSIGEQVTDLFDFSESGKSAHFQRVFSHPFGIRIELTELESGSGRNPGVTCLTLPGAFFYATDVSDQLISLWRIVNFEGFKWFTRLDFQSTELEPEWDAERVHQALVDREVWVRGYGSWRSMGDLMPDGSCPGGRTMYFGSPRSDRMGRTYDKARQAGWDRPAIRDEIQLRGDWAHRYGRELKAALNQNLTSDAMDEAVKGLTVQALGQHLQYWTLNGADPQTDKNWQRQAEPADWYQRRIGRASEPLRKGQREPLDFESTVCYGVRQYGRQFALWVEHHCLRTGLPREFVVRALYGRFFARVREEDLLGLGIVDTMAEYEAVKDYLSATRDELAQADEIGWWPE
jgi:hypothetical protein